MIDLYNAAMVALVEEKHKSNSAGISAQNYVICTVSLA